MTIAERVLSEALIHPDVSASRLTIGHILRLVERVAKQAIEEHKVSEHTDDLR